MAWSIDNTLLLDASVTEARIRSTGAQISPLKSVQQAVNALNSDPNMCPGVICAVFSERRGQWNILYVAHAKDFALRTFQGLCASSAAALPERARTISLAEIPAAATQAVGAASQRRATTIVTPMVTAQPQFSSMPARLLKAPAQTSAQTVRTRDSLMKQASAMGLESHDHGLGQWAVEHTRMFRKEIVLDNLAGKARVLSQFGSVNDAVNALKDNGILCPEGFCVMFSQRYQRCCLLFCEGMKDRALSVFQGLLELDEGAAPLWSVMHTRMLCESVELSEIQGRAKHFAEFDAVSTAVQRLNADDTMCPEGFCVIRSQKRARFCLLYRAGMQEIAFDALHELLDSGGPVSITAADRAALSEAEWAEYRSRVLVGDLSQDVVTEKTLFLGKMDSVSLAVAELNRDASICPNNSCALFSKKLGRFCLLYRKGKMAEALQPFMGHLETDIQAIRFTNKPSSFTDREPFAPLSQLEPAGGLREMLGPLLPAHTRDLYLELFRQKGEEVASQYPDLSPAQREVVVSYTAELDPQEDSPFMQCNSRMRDGTLEAWRPYIDFLYMSLLALPEITDVSVVFRGYKTALEDLQGDWFEGGVITLQGFTSVAEQLKVMNTFVGAVGGRTMLHLKLLPGTGRRLKALSLLPEEEEILLKPDVQFKIMGVVDCGGGLSMVECHQVEGGSVA